MISKISIVVVICCIATVFAQEKFCPLEKDGNQCRSFALQYKCAVFFENLPTTRPFPYTWIGGLPDVLNKKKVQESAEIRASFGNLKRKDFWFKEGLCNDVVGNARCYSAMLNPSKKPMDACQKTIINQDGALTVGDVLCDTIDEKGYARGLQSVNNVKITFRHSSCGGSWKQINNQGEPLTIKEDLCCTRVNGKLKFKRCDGSAFNNVCP